MAPETLRLRERIVQRSGGVPFFLVSCAAAVRQGMLRSDAPAALPWDLTHGIRQRVAALPAAAQEVLGVAATMGRIVPHHLLAAVAGLDEQAVLAALDAARHARLLEEDDEGYRFVHDVIRDVVEADLGMARRAVLHRRIAETLEQQTAGRSIELLAYHYARSGELPKAAHYLERAGDLAREQYALAAAEEHYRDLVGHLDRIGHTPDQARVCEKLGDVLMTMARYDEAQLMLDKAAVLYQATGDAAGETRTVALLGEGHFLRGTYAQGIGRLQALCRSAEGNQPSSGLAAAHTTLSTLLLVTGRFGEALASAERAAQVALRGCDARTRVRAEQSRGQALLVLGRQAEALQVLHEVIPLAETVGDLVSLYRALLNVAGVHFTRGELELERHLVQRALDAAERLGDPEAQAFVMDNAGWAAWFRGEWEAAHSYHMQALAFIRALGQSRLAATACIIRGAWCFCQGDGEEARHHLEEGIAVAERIGDLQSLPVAHWILAESDLLHGSPRAAIARLRPLLGRPGLQENVVTGLLPTLVLLPTLAWAYLEVGDVVQAEELVTQVLTRATSQGYLLPVIDTLRVQGMVRARQGRWHEAQHVFDEAIAQARTMPYPYGEARSHYEQGLLQQQRGATRRARTHLDAALAIFQRLGAAAHIERTMRALAAL